MRFQKGPTANRFMDRELQSAHAFAKATLVSEEREELRAWVTSRHDRCDDCGVRLYVQESDLVLPAKCRWRFLSQPQIIYAQKSSMNDYGEIMWRCENCGKLQIKLVNDTISGVIGVVCFGLAIVSASLLFMMLFSFIGSVI